MGKNFWTTYVGKKIKVTMSAGATFVAIMRGIHKNCVSFELDNSTMVTHWNSDIRSIELLHPVIELKPGTVVKSPTGAQWKFFEMPVTDGAPLSGFFRLPCDRLELTISPAAMDGLIKSEGWEVVYQPTPPGPLIIEGHVYQPTLLNKNSPVVDMPTEWKDKEVVTLLKENVQALECRRGMERTDRNCFVISKDGANIGMRMRSLVKGDKCTLFIVSNTSEGDTL